MAFHCRFYGQDIPVLPWFKKPHSSAVDKLRYDTWLGTALLPKSERRSETLSLLGARLEELLVSQDDEIDETAEIVRSNARLRKKRVAEKYRPKACDASSKARLAQQRALEEEASEWDVQVEGLRREFQDAHLALQREFEEKAARRDDRLRNLLAEKTHSLAEAVLRLEFAAQQLAQRVHIVERVLSPLFPAARYVSRMRHAIRRRLVLPRSKRVRLPQLPLDPPPRTERLGRTAVMLVADDRIDRRVLAQARSLAAQGWQVSVIAAPYPGPVNLDQEAFPEVRITRIDTNLPVPRFARPASTRLSATRDWIEAYFYHDHFLERALQHPATIVTAHDLPRCCRPRLLRRKAAARALFTTRTSSIPSSIVLARS